MANIWWNRRKKVFLHQNQAIKSMPLNPNKQLKTFYSIAEVSEMFGVPATTLRYWEKEFPSIHPRKNNGNIRMYSRDDIAEIQLVYDLIKVRNMKLSAAKDLIRRNHDGARNSSDLMSRLLEVREQLVTIKAELDKIV